MGSHLFASHIPRKVRGGYYEKISSLKECFNTPRAVVESPSVEGFRKQEDAALCGVV